MSALINRKLWLRLIFLADQIAFSGANFLLTALLARHYMPIELAAYGIGLSLALVILSVQRNCYLVQNTVLPPHIFRRRAAQVLGQHFIFSGFIILIFCAIILIFSAFDVSHYMQIITASTLVTYLLYSQLGFDRMILIKHERYLSPLLASTIFAVLIGIVFLTVQTWQLPYTGILTLIGMFAILKTGWLSICIAKPDLKIGAPLAGRALKRHFSASMAGLAGSAGFTHLPLMILGAVAAPLQTAVFVAMRSLTQPLQILIRSLDIMDKNFFHHTGVMTYKSMRMLIFYQTAIYGLLSACAAAFLFLFGEPLIHLIYGPRYDGFTNILNGAAIISALLAISFPLETGIVKLKRLNRFNTYRIIAGAVGTMAAFALCKDYGAMGATIAIIFGWLTSLACVLWLLRDVFFEPAKSDTVISGYSNTPIRTPLSRT